MCATGNRLHLEQHILIHVVETKKAACERQSNASHSRNIHTIITVILDRYLDKQLV